MANQMYGKGRQKFLEGSIAFGSDTIKVVLVNTASYSISINTDEFLSDIPSGMRVAISAALSSKTTTLGTADAADVTFSAVAGTVTVSLVVVYKDTGTASTSPLICAFDTGTGLPVTTNGGDITVQWDNGSNKIFTLFESISEKDKGLAQRLRDFFAGWKMPALEGSRGIWLPAPRILQTAPLIVPGV